MKLQPSTLKQKLKEHRITIGSWISIGHETIIDLMAQADFEWLVLDMEHTTLTTEAAKNLISATQAHGMESLVRVGANDELIIKKVLDAGANGIIVPMIKTRAGLEEAISYTQYPPTGVRGVGLFRAQNYGENFFEYRNWSKNNISVIAQIEHIDAVKNIDEILTTPGLDSIIVGPYDLSGSMGHPGEYDREEVQQALKQVQEACNKHNIPYGFHVVESDSSHSIEKLQKGCKLLAFSIDFLFLADRAKSEMKKIKEACAL